MLAPRRSPVSVSFVIGFVALIGPVSAHRKRRSCVRTTHVTTLTKRVAAAGQVRTAFTGWVRGRALSAGSYRATIVATDAAGARSIPRTVALRVIHG